MAMDSTKRLIEGEKCALLGEFGDLGWWLQGLLGVVSFSALLWKRKKEKPQRPTKVFFFDVSKQATGSLTLHFLNMGTSGLMAMSQGQDICTWYWLHIMVDTSLGIVILYWMVRILRRVFSGKKWMDYGQYGSPESYLICWKQILSWQVISIIMKLFVCIAMLLFQDFLLLIGNFVLGGFDHYPRLKLVMVMVVTPLGMNTLQYWLVDNFLKQNEARHIPIYCDIDDSRIEKESIRDIPLTQPSATIGKSY